MGVKTHVNLFQKMEASKYINKLIFFYYKRTGKEPDFSYVENDEKIKRAKFATDNLKKKFNEQLKLVKEQLKKEKALEQKEVILKTLQKNFQSVKNKIPEIKNNSLKTLKVENTYLLINYLRYVLLVIGFGAIYMSVYYSYEWLNDFLSPFKAAMLASIMVMFAVSAFELIILFRKEKKYYLVILFSFLWFIVTIFSMISTVAGQYNVRIADLTERYQNQSLKEKQVQDKIDYKEQKAELRSTLADLRKDNNYYQKQLNRINIKENEKQYRYLSWNLRRVQNRIEKILKELDSLRTSGKFEKVIHKRPPDFYLWVASLFGWKPDMIQFWLSVFPAVFIDLVAPISVAVFMFVKK